MTRETTPPRTNGFTLIELLVVMAIIGTLIGLGVAILPAMLRQGPKTAAKTFITTLSLGLEAYKSSEGAYPPTTLKDFAGISNPNDMNQGIEAVVVCLNSTRYTGSFDFADCKLDNLDTDMMLAQLTKFGVKDLFEVLDPWGTPYAYFNAQDYGRAEELGKIDGIEGTIKAAPWLNPKVKIPYRKDTFQLISAGPDHKFNTEDDVTNFERE